jgi:hypothetical protein
LIGDFEISASSLFFSLSRPPESVRYWCLAAFFEVYTTNCSVLYSVQKCSSLGDGRFWCWPLKSFDSDLKSLSSVRVGATSANLLYFTSRAHFTYLLALEVGGWRLSLYVCLLTVEYGVEEESRSKCMYIQHRSQSVSLPECRVIPLSTHTHIQSNEHGREIFLFSSSSYSKSHSHSIHE